MIGLVTVLYKSDNVLEGFFKSLAMQKFIHWHLFLVDNSPNEVTDSLIRSFLNKFHIAHVTHIRNQQNIGVAAGNNVGIKLSLEANCSHVLLLNNDIEFDQSDLIFQMITASSKQNVDIIVPKILFFDSRKIWMAGGKFFWYKGANKHVGEGDDDKPIYNLPGFYNYAPTCFMLLKRKVIEEVGIMDEKYFVYYDDTDFIYRCFKKSFLVYYMPELTILHKVSSSTGGNLSPFSVYYLYRNRIYFIRKHFFFLKSIVAFGYTALACVRWFLLYDRMNKKKLVQGIIDGFKL